MTNRKVCSLVGKTNSHIDADKKSINRQQSVKANRTSSFRETTHLLAKKNQDLLQKLIFEDDLDKVKAEVTKRGSVVTTWFVSQFRKSKDYDINEYDSHGNTPLHLAIQLHKKAIIKYFLALPKINPLKENLAGNPKLFSIVGSVNSQPVFNGNIQRVNLIGWTPLQEAAATNDIEIVQMVYKGYLLAHHLEYTTKLPVLAQTLKGVPSQLLPLFTSVSFLTLRWN